MKQRKNNGWEKGLIFLLLAVEAWYAFLLPTCEIESRNMIALGYFLLMITYPLSIRQKSNISKRESYLTIFFNWMILNFGTAFILIAFENQGGGIRVFCHALFLSIIGGVTLYALLFIGRFISKCRGKDVVSSLLIYGELDKKNTVWKKMQNDKINQMISANTPLADIEDMIQNYDRVYILDIPAEKRNDFLKLCIKLEKPVFCLSKLSDIMIQGGLTIKDEDKPYFYCDKYRLDRGERVIKRGMDIICSGLALVILSPLFLLIAICIKLEDGGPVIYKQIRCTRDGSEFWIYKFRSMVQNSEPTGARLATVNDERITKVGQILRNTKLDELPQLVNILRGEMSIVGPRPERPELVHKIMQEVPEFEYRMKVKAGLTGYAQVQGSYLTSPLDKLKWDLMYINQYSLMLDLKIILMTPFVVFNKNNREE